MPYLTDIRVRYGDTIDQKPSDAIREISGQDTNINAGFGGKFVWLVPRFSESDEFAVGYVLLEIQDQESDGDMRGNLAEGAGGKFRYIYPQCVGIAAYNVALLRSKEKVEWKPREWS